MDIPIDLCIYIDIILYFYVVSSAVKLARTFWDSKALQLILYNSRKFSLNIEKYHVITIIWL